MVHLSLPLFFLLSQPQRFSAAELLLDDEMCAQQSYANSGGASVPAAADSHVSVPPAGILLCILTHLLRPVFFIYLFFFGPRSSSSLPAVFLQ